MKFLIESYRDFKKRDYRWLFNSIDKKNRLESNDTKNFIESASEEELLQSFSLKNIKELDEFLKHSEGREWMRKVSNVRRYQNLVEHHLLLGERENLINKVYPSRILHAIQQSSRLKYFLLPVQTCIFK